MHNILTKIIESKKNDLNREMKNQFSFKKAMLSGYRKNMAIIAELKFASPTNPNLGSPKDLLDRARQYKKAGADAISIITEKTVFKGDVSFVSQVKNSVDMPILQKDFVIHEYQIYEAKIRRSDAILLIARILTKKTLKYFVNLAIEIGIEPVVEVYSMDDIDKAVVTETSFIAVNSRDLDTFLIEIDRACVLLNKIPDKFIKLGFSGIKSFTEVKKYKDAGAKGILVGTSLMNADNIGNFIHDLRKYEYKS